MSTSSMHLRLILVLHHHAFKGGVDTAIVKHAAVTGEFPECTLPGFECDRMVLSSCRPVASTAGACSMGLNNVSLRHASRNPLRVIRLSRSEAGFTEKCCHFTEARQSRAAILLRINA